MSNEYGKSFFASFLSYYNWLFTICLVWNYRPDWRGVSCFLDILPCSYIHLISVLPLPKEKYRGLWILMVKMLKSLKVHRMMELPCQGAPGEAVIQYWPTHSNCRDNTNPQEHWPSRAAHAVCGTGAQRKGRGKNCLLLFMELHRDRVECQSDQCSENNDREARESDLVRLYLCLLKGWAVSLARSPCKHSTRGTALLHSLPQGWASPRDRTAHPWEAARATRDPHISVLNTSLGLYTSWCQKQLNFCVVPEGKAKIPPVARVKKEKRKWERHNTVNLCKKKINAQLFKTFIWHLLNSFQHFY